MNKKRKDRRIQKSFTYKGKRYFVYGYNAQELYENEKAKREEIAKKYDIRMNPSLNEYFERWLDNRRGTVKECTIRTQDKEYHVMARIIIPDASRTFGEIKVKDIAVEDIRIVQSELLKDRKSRTVNDYMALLKHILYDAMHERIIDFNPCEAVKNFKQTEEEARDTIHRALTIEEQQAFFGCDRTRSSHYYNVFRIAILTGMRAGEIGALKNTDIKDGVINVERTITRTEVGGYTIGDSAKTAAGRRSIPLNDAIKDVLESQRYINKMLYGNVLSINDLLFKAPEGGLLMATPADREIKRICKRIGIEPFTLHALRATFATRAIESGMNPRTLQELLGHKDFSITMNLYAHVMDDTKKKAMDALNIAL